MSRTKMSEFIDHYSGTSAALYDRGDGSVCGEKHRSTPLTAVGARLIGPDEYEISSADYATIEQRILGRMTEEQAADVVRQIGDHDPDGVPPQQGRRP